ncbi:MAG TPA: dihydrouridine synthase [Treponema sp.]|nr:dihydrouridine synthase [Treponema sp.]
MPKLLCAPMATLSHEAFRRTIEKFGGCDEYFTEMINAPSLLNMGPFEKYYLMDGPVPEKIVWQLTGSSSSPLAKAASLLSLKNGIGIDLNMGCSAPQIYKTGAGIAWMLKPLDETREMVRAVKDALNETEVKTGIHKRLSVKCRLGNDDFTDESFFSFTDMLFEEGVEAVTLHPRTLKEKLRGWPRWEYAEKLSLRYPGMKINVNGEITDAKSAKKAMEKAPHADGLMIGRMAAQKPWIFSTLKQEFSESPEDERKPVDAEQVALDYIDLVEEFQPPEFHRTRLQRFFSYYCKTFTFGHYFQTQMLNYHSVEECREKVRDYFAKVPDDRFQ